MKIFFFFPNSKFLKDKWWHRLAKTIFIASIIFGLIITTYQVYDIRKNIKKYGSPAELEDIIRIKDMSPPEEYDMSLEQHRFMWGVSQTLFKKNAEEKRVKKACVLSISSLFSWILMIFSYRFILYIAFGNKWRDKSGKKDILK